jgi:hypothetical protein
LGERVNTQLPFGGVGAGHWLAGLPHTHEKRLSLVRTVEWHLWHLITKDLDLLMTAVSDDGILHFNVFYFIYHRHLCGI